MLITLVSRVAGAPNDTIAATEIESPTPSCHESISDLELLVDFAS